MRPFKMKDVEILYRKLVEQYFKYAETKAGPERNSERLIYERLLKQWQSFPESVRSEYPSL